MGRRANPRFSVVSPWDGVMRILRDVVVVRTAPEELVAVSPCPGVVGEVMGLELAGGRSSADLQVRVVESRPVIVNGGVRHRVRLALHPGDQEAGAVHGAT